MGLRYRLFLWVSGLFVALAITSYFLTDKVTSRELARAQISLREEILSLSEERRKNLEGFIAESIAENLVKIDAILSNILQYAPVARRFSPITVNEEKGTWGESSNLLLEYRWIDFLQNTADNKVVALVSPKKESVNEIYQVPINKNLFWVYFAKNATPYLGVKIPYFLVKNSANSGETLDEISGEVPIVFFAFDVEKMKVVSMQSLSNQQWPAIPVKWIEGYSLDVESFATSLVKAQQMLQAGELTPPSLSIEEIDSKISAAKEMRAPLLSPAFLSSLPQEELMKRRLEEVSLEYTQINLLWIWMALFDSGVWGNDLFKFPSPLSMGMIAQSHPIGLGIQADNALFSSAVFADAAYYQTHSFQDQESGLGNGIALIPSADRLFLGNTAQFVVELGTKKHTGYLTLGIDADRLLEKLVLALNQTVILVHKGKIFGAYQADGETLKRSVDLPFNQMQDRPSGIIPWKDQNYFYMHLQPFAGEDLHLILLNPEKKEFALLHDLQAGSQEVVNAILFNIHMTGFVALLIAIIMVHRISRRITEPIVELAEATEHVALGNFEKVQLKSVVTKHHDEVAQLYHAFEKMVVGLQEKEKVKAVLNKVVSQDIAQEILKGTVHLGGEEKKVSVLFADIRGFTNMTQHLPPAEVIDMLNICMTKLSAVVDQNKGVIDKYVGDEVMALFGAPVPRGNDTLHAVVSAIEMMQIIKKWNTERALKGLKAIEIGIGIHTGLMLAGNMGAENRLNYTVIGRNVNLAARLCSAAKPMEILVSLATLQEVRDHVNFEPLEPLTLKGFDSPVEVYRILGQK